MGSKRCSTQLAKLNENVIFNDSSDNAEDNKSCNIFEKQPANLIKVKKRFLIFLFWEPAGNPAACNFRK